MILEAAILTILLVLGCWVCRTLSTLSPENLPPGPRPYPVIGNMIRLMERPLHLAMTDLAKEYGKIFTVYLPFGQRCIVVSSIGLARETLLSKKDDFSGRPESFIGDYLTRDGKGIVRTDFSQTMIMQRKLVHSALRVYGRGLSLELKVCEEVEKLLKRFSAHQGNAIDPRNDINLMVLNVISDVVYGERYELEDEEFRRIVKYNDLLLRLFFKGFNVLELFPWMRHFPLEEERILREARELRDAVLDTKYREHKKKFDDSEDKKEIEVNNLIDALIKAFYDSREKHAKVSTLLTEDIEMDEVIGRDRLPCLEDRGNLPYLESTVAEMLRLATVAPLSVPHKSTRHSSLGGYDIPKDTMVLTNLWAIHHDTDEWETPDVFNPERFLDGEGNFSASGPKGYHSFLPFGAGRRGCLGEILAKSELFLVSSRLLHQFTLQRAPGQPLPDLTSHVGAAVIPGSYKISIKNRMF